MMIGSVLVFIVIIRLAPISPGEAAISCVPPLGLLPLSPDADFPRRFAHSAMAISACRIILNSMRAAEAPPAGTRSAANAQVSHATMVFQRRASVSAFADSSARAHSGVDILEMDDLSASGSSPESSQRDRQQVLSGIA